MSDNNSVPKHLAIIMDGNGRWALEKHLDRSEGHIKGYQNIKSITLMAKKLGVKYLTLFAFSTENWNRPLKEVNFIMNLALEVIIKESEELSQNNINITHLGDKKNLSTEMIQKIKKSEELTKNNNEFFLSIAFNYGARNEIINAVNKIIQKKIISIDEEIFSSNLMSKDYPDPDMIIRTGGEKRLSTFLLWQAAYAELYFEDKFWPDFKINDLERIISNYSLRKRNFGN